MSYAYAKGRPRLKCMRPLCSWYGKGLAVSKVQAQLIQHLRDNVDRMVALNEKPPAPAVITPEQLEVKAQLVQLEALQKQGVPGLENSINDLRRRLTPAAAPRTAGWANIADLVRRDGVLESFAEEELRELFLEFFTELLYVGNPNRIEVRLRDDPSQAAA